MSVFDDILAELRAIRALLTPVPFQFSSQDLTLTVAQFSERYGPSPGEGEDAIPKNADVGQAKVLPDDYHLSAFWRTAAQIGQQDAPMAVPLQVWSCGHPHATRGEAVACLRQQRETLKPLNADAAVYD